MGYLGDRLSGTELVILAWVGFWLVNIWLETPLWAILAKWYGLENARPVALRIFSCSVFVLAFVAMILNW